MGFSKIADHNVAPLLLNAEEISKLIPFINIRDSLEETFKSLHKKNAIQPPQTLSLFSQNKGDFITYTGAINELEIFGAKLSPYLITDDKPIITAWTYLMSQRTGMPLLCCDSSQLTIERTAGTTALAVDKLAAKNSQNLSIIGSGEAALAHLKHVLTLRNWTRITVFSPNLNNNINQQNKFTTIYPKIIFAETNSEACEGADVIMLCTSSGKPVVALADIQPGVLITSISTNVKDAHEVPLELLSRAEVYCDYKETAPLSAGEMKIAIKNDTWNSTDLQGDLADLVTQTCSLPSFTKPIFFRSIGLGLEDIAIAYAVWQHLQE